MSASYWMSIIWQESSVKRLKLKIPLLQGPSEFFLCLLPALLTCLMILWVSILEKLMSELIVLESFLWWVQSWNKKGILHSFSVSGSFFPGFQKDRKSETPSLRQKSSVHFFHFPLVGYHSRRKAQCNQLLLKVYVFIQQSIRNTGSLVRHIYV